jgi:hypothetical protein
MSRNQYQINRQRYLTLDQILEFTGEGETRVFPLDPTLVIDWTLFFPTPAQLSDSYVNFSRPIDPYIAKALHELVVPNLPEIVLRALKLPFGREPTLALVDAHTNNGTVPSAQGALSWLQAAGYDLPMLNADQIQSGPMSGVESFKTGTPLFYYLLRESELLEGGHRMGPLGSRIVAETICGLLELDDQSILRRADWKPLIRTASPTVVAVSDIIEYLRGSAA